MIWTEVIWAVITLVALMTAITMIVLGLAIYTLIYFGKN